jgi:hypothetical protein
MEFISSLTKYLKDLEDKNLFLKRNCDKLTRENERLKDDEKELFKVSSIISTSNENTKLKNYIKILEEQLKKYKPTVIYEAFQEKEIVLPGLEIVDVIQSIEESIEPSIDSLCDVIHDQSINVITSICDVSIINNMDDDILVNEEDKNSVLEEEEDKTEELRHLKYKGISYLIDENNVLHENVDNEKGDVVGKRRLNSKTNKWKTTIY